MRCGNKIPGAGWKYAVFCQKFAVFDKSVWREDKRGFFCQKPNVWRQKIEERMRVVNVG